MTECKPCRVISHPSGLLRKMWHFLEQSKGMGRCESEALPLFVWEGRLAHIPVKYLETKRPPRLYSFPGFSHECYLLSSSEILGQGRGNPANTKPASSKISFGHPQTSVLPQKVILWNAYPHHTGDMHNPSPPLAPLLDHEERKKNYVVRKERKNRSLLWSRLWESQEKSDKDTRDTGLRSSNTTCAFIEPIHTGI